MTTNGKSGLDEFAIYTKSLSAAEVTQLYQNTGISVNTGTTNYCALAEFRPDGQRRREANFAVDQWRVQRHHRNHRRRQRFERRRDLRLEHAQHSVRRDGELWQHHRFEHDGDFVSPWEPMLLRCTVTDGGGLTDYDRTP